MASIPLPALHVNPPPDPAENIQRLIQLRQLMALQPGQLQLQQQQIQSGQQEAQIRGQQIKDQQAQTAAMQEWDGKDINALPGLVLKHGASAQAVMSMKTGIIKQQQDMANLTKDQLGNEKAKNDYFVQSLDNVKQLPPEQQPQAFQSAISDAVQKGHLDPRQAQGMQYEGPQQLDMLEKALMGHGAVVEQALKQQQTSEAAAKGGEATAQTNKLKAELEFYQKKGLAPGVPLDVQEAQDWLSKNPGKGPAEFMAYKAKLVPQFNFNLQNAGGAPGAGGQPSPIAQAIADGSMKWGDAVSMRTPMSVKAAMLAEVKKINPAFNSGDFQVEQAVKKAFTSGPEAKTLNAFNTAAEHLKLLDQLSTHLDNGNLQAVNFVANKFATATGSAAPTSFEMAKNAVAGEVSKTFKGGGATDEEIKSINSTINQAQSPAQLKGAISTATALMNSKREALQQQFEAGKKAQPNFGAQAANAQTGEITVAAPNGKTYTFKDQASADAFKAKAGIK